MATIIVIGSFIVVEILAELVMAIVWTANAKHHFVGLTVFAAAIAYYAPGVVSAYKIVRKCYRCRKKFKKGKYSIEEAKIKALFKCFVWITAYFAYFILYSFFPAFVLAFAYPTRVITIFALMATFLLLSIVYLTTYIKKGVNLKILKYKRPANICTILCIKLYNNIVNFAKRVIFIILIILLLYFFLLIFALLYALVIGRASVVSSAPLALLSLLPSILISIAAWVMKSTMLKNDNDTNNNVENEKTHWQDGVNAMQTNREEASQDRNFQQKRENYNKIELDTIN